MSKLERARSADARARDMIAIALDRHLANATLIRHAATKFLTSPMTRAFTSADTIAKGPGWDGDERGLGRAIATAGGISLRALRREMLLVRLAAIFEQDDATWAIAAEVLGVFEEETLRRNVSRLKGDAPAWRARAHLAIQFNDFEAILTKNAPAWARVQPRAHGARVRQCPHCHAILRQEAA